MRTESGSIIYSYVMGVILFGIGALVEPLMMVLGGLIVFTGTIAKIAESRRLKYQALEAEKSEKGMASRVA